MSAMPDKRLERFKSKFEALKGHVHSAGTWEEAAGLAVEICRGASARRMATARTPAPFCTALERSCLDSGLDLSAPPYASESLPGAIDKVDVGITGIDFAIARTGTLVEVSLDDATRLVSSLPRTHIGLVSERELVEDLDDAAPRLREILTENSKNCVVSFLSGPSRTGDIEMRLTLGVHGPESAHVILLSEALDMELTHG